MSNHEKIRTFEPQKYSGELKMPDFNPRMLDLLMGHRSDPVVPPQRVTHIPNATITFTTTDEKAEFRSVNSETGAEKGVKLARYDLIPQDALRELAEHYGRGAKKYADHNWRKKYEWSKSFAALSRHLNQFWNGEDYDEETGTKHIIAVAWHAFVLATYMDENREMDDRWSTIVDPPEDEHG